MQGQNLIAWMSIGRLTAICLFVLGGAIAASALSYEIGTLRRMGPGYFPMLLGIALCLIALVMFFQRSDDEAKGATTGEQASRSNWRALLFPLAGILAFAFLIKAAGFVPALFTGAVLAGLADPKNRLVELGIIATLVTGFAALIFVYGLGIPVQLVAF